jgi:hypothetical protein
MLALEILVIILFAFNAALNCWYHNVPAAFNAVCVCFFAAIASLRRQNH